MRTFEERISNMFNGPGLDYAELNVQDVSYESSSIFNRYLNIDLRGPIVESPIICKDIVERSLNDGLANDGIKKDYLILSLYKGGRESTARTAESIIKNLLGTSYNNRLNEVHTPKGICYYGGAGMIFDSTMTCILLYTIKYDIKDNVVKMITPVLHIHPKVFMSNDIVEKNIIKRIIPIMLEKKVSLTAIYAINDFNYNGSRNFTSKIPEIVISERANDFISTPDTPVLDNFTNEKVNEYLANNIDVDLLKQVSWH